jgi:DNA-binding ferritin-like protein (Dps family)
MKNFLEIVTGSLREKAEYKASRKLLASLPEDYQFVYKEIEKYIFSLYFDENVFPVLLNIIESFAIAATDGRSVFSVTGEDVGLFCDDLLKKIKIKTWADRQREKLNENIQKKFGNK